MRRDKIALFSFSSSSSFLISCIMRISSAELPWSLPSAEKMLLYLAAWVSSCLSLKALYSLKAS